MVVVHISKFNLPSDFYGVCDEDTIYAPTTHTYFNLGGTPTVHGTMIKINADKYVAVDDELIPTEVKNADGIFDFKNGIELKENYDHCFILRGGENAFSAEAGGIKMSFDTDFPALQLYTGEFLKDGFSKNSGFAAEPEYCPDSPNRPYFPPVVLKPGEVYTQKTIYKFGVE